MAATSEKLRLDSPEFIAFSAFANLTTEKRHLKDRLKEIEEEMEHLEPTLLGYLGQSGYETLGVGGYTMSAKRDPWVRPAFGVSREAICGALKAAGLDYLVSESFSTRSLTKYVRQLEEHHQLLAELDPAGALEMLPPELEGLIEIRPGYTLQVLKARRKSTRQTPESEEMEDQRSESDEIERSETDE